MVSSYSRYALLYVLCVIWPSSKRDGVSEPNMLAVPALAAMHPAVVRKAKYAVTALWDSKPETPAALRAVGHVEEAVAQDWTADRLVSMCFRSVLL